MNVLKFRNGFFFLKLCFFVVYEELVRRDGGSSLGEVRGRVGGRF